MHPRLVAARSGRRAGRAEVRICGAWGAVGGGARGGPGVEGEEGREVEGEEGQEGVGRRRGAWLAGEC